MAGGLTKYRHLSRKSSHRQALLRNIVDSLIEHESVQTTWAKAKEAQRLAEKVITLGKKGTEASRRRAQQIFYRPALLIPKLFTTLATRYASRPGGYTRVLRIEPIKEDQAPSAILELIDGPKDIRWAMTARTLARQRREDLPETPLTRQNVQKVIKYRKNGLQELEKLASWFEERVEPESEEKVVSMREKKKVYPDPDMEKPRKARHTQN